MTRALLIKTLCCAGALWAGPATSAYAPRPPYLQPPAPT